MHVENFFDFARDDVVTAGDDEVFLAVNNIDIAIVIHLDDVAGVYPAATIENRGGFLRIIPIALHHLGAIDDQLAFFGMGQLGIVAALIWLQRDNFDIGVGNGWANRAYPSFAAE